MPQNIKTYSKSVLVAATVLDFSVSYYNCFGEVSYTFRQEDSVNFRVLCAIRCLLSVILLINAERIGTSKTYYWSNLCTLFGVVSCFLPIVGSLCRQLLTGNSTFAGDISSEAEKCAQPPPLGPYLLLWRMVHYAKREWKWCFVALLCLICNAAAAIHMPFYTGNVITVVATSGTYDDLLDAIKLRGTVELFSLTVGTIEHFCSSYLAAAVLLRVKDDLFQSVLQQEIGFFDSVKTAGDCRTIGDRVGYEIGAAIRLLLLFVGGVAVMATISGRLTLLTLAVVPGVAVVTKLYGDYCERVAEQTSDRLAASNEVADEVISSIRTVRSFAAEAREAARYRTTLRQILGFNAKKAISTFLYYFVVEMAELLTLLSVLWYGGWLVLNGRINAGDLVSFMLYQRQMGSTIQELSNVVSGWIESVGSARKVFAFMDRTPEIQIDDQGQTKLNRTTDIKGIIRFDNVSFSYPTRPQVTVLKKLSFTIEQGETVALVGPSGGGKTTCISLLQRFYEPTDGTVLIDQRPLAHYSHSRHHSLMSLVSQEPVLFARSIAENISYGTPDAVSEAQIERAAVLANADEFIRRLPHGYHTQVGQKGLNLSGGQKQRIAIARALIANPKIILFDEATSALDATSEQAVQEAIYSSLQGHTVLLIAHRLSTVRRANRIIVIDNGTAVQIGSHSELMAEKSGLYRSLVKDQLFNDELR